ncbi:MAG: serine hydrolase [Gemmatimonadaceae bacterium]
MLLPLVSLAGTLLLQRPAPQAPQAPQAPAGVPVRAPWTVGMSAERLAEVDRIIGRGIAAGAYPGAAVVIGRNGAAVWQKGYGRQSWSNGSTPVGAQQTIYDLASLTKPIVIATAAMILYDEGKLDLDARVVDILPEFTGPGKQRIRVRHLLSHHAGLPAGRRLWLTANSPEEAWQQMMQAPAQLPPMHTMTYSDLGAAIMGKVIERLSGMPLDRLAETRIFAPLGMHDTFFRPPGEVRARIAPTETNPPRGYSLCAEVHDESAYTLGGVSGHAGLFGSATDVAIFAQMMVNRGIYNGVRLIADSTVRLFTTHVRDNRTLGWEVAAGERGSGEFLGANAYGHVGYTGTSIWIDPDRQLFVVLMTNRVHAARARRPGIIIADVRHDVADAAALSIMDVPTLRQVAWPRTFRVDQAADWRPPTRVAERRPTTLPRQAAPSSPDASDLERPQ